MSYSIRWKQKPLKIFGRLQQNVALRLWTRLDMLKEDPFRYLKHFEGEDVYKFRVGKYRFLIDVNKNKKLLIIQVFDKSGRIYKR